MFSTSLTAMQEIPKISQLTFLHSYTTFHVFLHSKMKREIIIEDHAHLMQPFTMVSDRPYSLPSCSFSRNEQNIYLNSLNFLCQNYTIAPFCPLMSFLSILLHLLYSSKYSIDPSCLHLTHVSFSDQSLNMSCHPGTPVCLISLPLWSQKITFKENC